MNKLLDFLNIGLNDKVMHAMYGTVIFVLLVVYVMSPIYALGVVSVIAVLKEWYDGTTDKHTRDVWDAVATVIIPFIYVIGVW